MVVVEGNHTHRALEGICQVGCDRQGSLDKARTSLSISVNSALWYGMKTYLDEFNLSQLKEKFFLQALTPKIRSSQGSEESRIREVLLLFIFTYMQRFQLCCVRWFL
jgi:hypothetical protein